MVAASKPEVIQAIVSEHPEMTEADAERFVAFMEEEGFQWAMKDGWEAPGDFCSVRHFGDAVAWREY